MVLLAVPEPQKHKVLQQGMFLLRIQRQRPASRFAFRRHREFVEKCREDVFGGGFEACEGIFGVFDGSEALICEFFVVVEGGEYGLSLRDTTSFVQGVSKDVIDVYAIAILPSRASV